MALSRKKYFIYIIFLVSPIALSLYAQNSVERPTNSIDSNSNAVACENQIKDTADHISISKLDNSNQFIVGPSIPKDGLVMALETKDQTSNCDQNSSISALYSVLAKDIIENYKYDFSETFIDILFFENIDLARTRTI
jgi:nitrogenase subunit NifH